MKTLALSILLLCLPLSATTNYYISTSGSDSTGDGSSGNPWATAAHALGIVPLVLDTSYQINVSGGSGTFAEPINTNGHIGYQGNMGLGPIGISIVGNNSSPSSVQFTGTVACGSNVSGGATAGLCVGGPVSVSVSGVEVNVTAVNAAYCDSCLSLALAHDVFTGTLTNGIEAFKGTVYFNDSVTVSGFASSLGIGVYIGHGSIADLAGGTLTITGPGGSSTTSLGLVVEYKSDFDFTPASGVNPNLTITGVQYGIQLSAVSNFSNFVSTGTVSVSNSTTPANSHGLDVGATSTFGISAGSLSVSNFTYCAFGYLLGAIADGPGNRTFSCTNSTGSPGNQGQVFILF